MSSQAAENYKEKGNAEFKAGNYEKAIENYTYSIEMDPKNHIYLTNRSLCYSNMKKWDKSLRDAEKAIAIKNDWEKGWFRKGVALVNLGKHEEAMQAFQKCMDINPNNADYKAQYTAAKRELYKGLSEAEIAKLEGNEFFKKGAIQEAIDKYTQAIGKSGADEKSLAVKADCYANRAACYVQLYEPTKVKADCDAALKIDPKHVKALLRRGQANESLEKYKLALEDFEAALQIEPGSNLAIQAIGRIKRALKNM